jgi:hypothetical protein
MAHIPLDGAEGELFLVALGRFSAECEAPALTEECPFAIVTGPGQRGCGEECMDLLAEHGQQAPNATDLGNGILLLNVRRSRPRRGRHGSTAKPYDATEMYLEDKATGPPQMWRFPSLVRGAQAILQTEPPVDSDDEMRERASQLEKLALLIESHGLDFRAQILPFMVSTVTSSLVAVSNQRSDGSVGQWGALFRERVGDSPNAVEGMTRQFFEFHIRASAWLNSLDLVDLAAWLPPTPEEFDAVSPDSLLVDGDTGQWITDRCLDTYLHDWVPSSLRLEWMYLHGQTPAPISKADMATRSVPIDELARELANRSVQGDHFRQDGLAVRTSELVVPAVRFLEQGQRDLAAALFQAIVDVRPSDPEAQNNLGFCLAPDDPERALRHLDCVKASGTSQTLSAVNRVACLGRVGRFTAALDLVGDLLSDADLPWPFSSYLWSPREIVDGSEPSLVKVTNVVAYVRDLAAAVAEATGDAELMAKWPHGSLPEPDGDGSVGD